VAEGAHVVATSLFVFEGDLTAEFAVGKLVGAEAGVGHGWSPLYVAKEKKKRTIWAMVLFWFWLYFYFIGLG
jgi:hypothetical protein